MHRILSLPQKYSSLSYLLLLKQIQYPDESEEVNILSNGFSVFQLRMFGFEMALVPTTYSINSIKMSLSSLSSSWIVITEQLSEKYRGKNACLIYCLIDL